MSSFFLILIVHYDNDVVATSLGCHDESLVPQFMLVSSVSQCALFLCGMWGHWVIMKGLKIASKRFYQCLQKGGARHEFT